MRYKGKVLLNRLLKMPEHFDTTLLQAELGVSWTVIYTWTAKPEFAKYGVAERRAFPNERKVWWWGRDKLILWLVALGTLRMPKVKYAENPHEIRFPGRAEARRMIGLQPVESEP